VEDYQIDTEEARLRPAEEVQPQEEHAHHPMQDGQDKGIHGVMQSATDKGYTKWMRNKM
jgi:hypothetical protein